MGHYFEHSILDQPETSVAALNSLLEKSLLAFLMYGEYIPCRFMLHRVR